MSGAGRSNNERRAASRKDAEVLMTIGTGTPDDPIIVVDWSGFYDWGIWRTARHCGTKNSDPLATGSLDGVVNFAHRSIKRTSKVEKRPMLAHWENGRWRAKDFIEHDECIQPISPGSTPDAKREAARPLRPLPLQRGIVVGWQPRSSRG
jgi:hypothetical protein